MIHKFLNDILNQIEFDSPNGNTRYQQETDKVGAGNTVTPPERTTLHSPTPCVLPPLPLRRDQ